MNKILILAAASLALTACSVDTSPGKGDKVGQIVKIQEQGLVCKTPVILVTGKFGGGELLAAIRSENTALLKKAHEFNDSQEQVKVFYNTEFVEDLCDVGDHAGNTFVTDIVPWTDGAAEVDDVK